MCSQWNPSNNFLIDWYDRKMLPYYEGEIEKEYIFLKIYFILRPSGILLVQSRLKSRIGAAAAAANGTVVYSFRSKLNGNLFRSYIIFFTSASTSTITSAQTTKWPTMKYLWDFLSQRNANDKPICLRWMQFFGLLFDFVCVWADSNV